MTVVGADVHTCHGIRSLVTGLLHRLRRNDHLTPTPSPDRTYPRGDVGVRETRVPCKAIAFKSCRFPSPADPAVNRLHHLTRPSVISNFSFLWRVPIHRNLSPIGIVTVIVRYFSFTWPRPTLHRDGVQSSPSTASRWHSRLSAFDYHNLHSDLYNSQRSKCAILHQPTKFCCRYTISTRCASSSPSIMQHAPILSRYGSIAQMLPVLYLAISLAPTFDNTVAQF